MENGFETSERGVPVDSKEHVNGGCRFHSARPMKSINLPYFDEAGQVSVVDKERRLKSGSSHLNTGPE